MNDNFALFFLKFSEGIFILPILFVGYLWLNRNIFYNATCISLFSVIYVRFLKVFFQIYSPGYGLSFPSGHALFATVFYGFIAFKFNSILIRFICTLIILLTYYSLVYLKYHDLFHIYGSFFFGMVLIYIYNAFIFKSRKKYEYSLPLIGAFLIFYQFMIDGLIKPYQWSIEYGIIGFIISHNKVKLKKLILSLNEKILSTFIAFIAFFLFSTLYSNYYLPDIISQSKWFFIGLMLPISRNISISINSKIIGIK